MIELTNQFIYSKSTEAALVKICGMEFDPKTAYNLRRIQNQCQKGFTALRQEYKDIIKKHSKTFDDKTGKHEIAEGKQESLDKELAELMTRKFTLEKVNKIHLDLICDAKLSAFDFEALEPILDGLDL